jgi:hypothetical protein
MRITITHENRTEVVTSTEKRAGFHLLTLDASFRLDANQQFFFPVGDFLLLEKTFSQIAEGQVMIGITSGILTPKDIAVLVKSTQSITNPPEKASFMAFVGAKEMTRREFTFDRNRLMNNGGWVSWAKGTKIEPKLQPRDVLDHVAGVQHGGHWSPSDCEPRFKVAIIVPYKDRLSHLKVFTYNLANFLKLQNLAFSIYAIEPTGKGVCFSSVPLCLMDGPSLPRVLRTPGYAVDPYVHCNNLSPGDVKFNRAMLMNIGFLEARKVADYDCYVFHDVDLIPFVLENYYGCYDLPRHVAVLRSSTRFQLRYQRYFGGAVGLTGNQIERINGFPNLMFGWGGEDDDILNRS